MRHQEELSIVIKTIMLEQPFYGLFLLNVNKEFDKRVPTAGVTIEGINYKLIVNPDFWDSLSDDHKQGLILHEAKHIVFNHLLMRDDFANPKLANVAMDCELNQYIDPKLLPDGAILPAGLEQQLGITLNIKAGTHYYYNAINDELEQQAKGNPDKACNGGEGGMGVDGLPDTLDDHSDWDNVVDGMSEAEKKLVTKQNEYIIKEAAEQTLKAHGHLPGGVQEIYNRITQVTEAKFNWKAYLRQFVNGSIRSTMKSSRKKINRRLEKQDVPGKKYLRKVNMLVAIDTSGSVSSNELTEFMNEIHHIHKNGAEVTIIQCDARINSIDKFNPKMNIEIKGRGGTEFDPVIDYYNKNRSQFTCLVYFTDGECHCEIKPQGKLLWVLSSVSQINENLPGPQIKLN
jgi:predicted metal-dependent peptidase